MSLVAWGEAWARYAWAPYAWLEGELPPETEEPESAPTGAGAKAPAKRRRYPLPEQVTRQARDTMLDMMAQRRAAEVTQQAGLAPPPAVSVEAWRAAALPAIAALPVTEARVQARPGGRAKWAQRQRLDLSAARAKFQDRAQRALELARYEQQLQDELAEAARRERDIVFISAMLAAVDDMEN